MMTATATEVKNNFGHFLAAVQAGDEIIIVKNGKEVARIVSRQSSVSFLTDSLTGVLKNDYDDKNSKKLRNRKYFWTIHLKNETGSGTQMFQHSKRKRQRKTAVSGDRRLCRTGINPVLP